MSSNIDLIAYNLHALEQAIWLLYVPELFCTMETVLVVVRSLCMHQALFTREHSVCIADMMDFSKNFLKFVFPLALRTTL